MSASRTVVVFDAESDVSFANCVGATRAEQMANMQATVVCALVLDATLCEAPVDPDRALATAVAHHWWRDDNSRGSNPFEPLLELFDAAELIVAYNGIGFDFPLLRKHYTDAARYCSHRAKCHDPMLRIKHTYDEMPKLDALLAVNGLPTKTSEGLEAIRMWEQGRREELRAYCAEDVRLLALVTLQPTVRLPGIGEVNPNVIALGPWLAAIGAIC